MDNIKTVSFGCDHGGYPFKEEIVNHLKELGYEVLDCGTYSKESCNYPDPAFKAATAVAEGKAQAGILVCSSGEGVSICANKVKGVICGIGYNDDVSHLIVTHNHANMIAFGGAYMTLEDILRRIDIFFHSVPHEGRHQRRVDIIRDYEEKHFK